MESKNKLFLLTLLAAAGCGGLPAADPPADVPYYLSCPCRPHRGVDSGLAYLPELMWPIAAEISVCFEGTTWPAARGWIQDAVQQTWGLASTVQFVGWGRCDAGDADIRVGLADTLSVAGLGTQLSHVGQGVVLGTFTNTEREIRLQAVYAFGFVLGFTAEQDRGDTPATCDTLHRFPSYAVRVLGPWDDSSVMNDCNVNRYNDGLLSEGDIAGAQRVYGEPASCGC